MRKAGSRAELILRRLQSVKTAFVAAVVLLLPCSVTGTADLLDLFGPSTSEVAYLPL